MKALKKLRKKLPLELLIKGSGKFPNLLSSLLPNRLKQNFLDLSFLIFRKKITETLKSFEVDGEITEITPGPILTIYEFQPGPGVRVQKIQAVATDLAMALGAPAIRIVAPIPGKSVAGIEVPNPEREEIVLREILETALTKTNFRLPLCLGKDTEGKTIIEDLSRMPHLLIGRNKHG
jgi:S-DNA-T family DNA segregation ATPase FtsK/SpoIIIE